MKLLRCTLLWLLMPINICYADTGVGVASGIGANHTKVYRVSLQRTWSCATTNNHKVNGYWDLATERINAKETYPYPTNKNLQATSVSGVLRFKHKFKIPCYLDLGVGLSYFSKQHIAKRNLGSNLLFEDRLGFGVLLGKRQQFEIGYRALHYSNAYLASVNNGLNLQLLVLGYWFK